MAQQRIPIFIGRSASVTTDPDGAVRPEAMIGDRRSRKVGVLPDLARVVLATAGTCLEGRMRTDPHRAGVSLGTVYGSMHAAQTSLVTMHVEGFGGIVPSWYATGLPNATTAIVASLHDLGGPNLTFLGRQAGIDAILAAARQIVLGRADGMLCGAFDIPGATFNRIGRAGGVARSSEGAAGLLWLTRESADDGVRARLHGWVQQDEDTGAGSPSDALVDLALERSAVRRSPTVHALRDDDFDGRDFLAATAPLHLIGCGGGFMAATLPESRE